MFNKRLGARQEKILILVIENYIAAAEPVGSRFLVDEGDLEWSEATVRNELRALEEAGYLTHPHTSAGRVPTERGYRYYADRLALNKTRMSNQRRLSLEKVFKQAVEFELACKNLAKEAAEWSKESIILFFSPDKVYYTGLANLFGKPEFTGVEAINVSKMFDQCEECLIDFADMVADEPQFFIGSEHPFGPSITLTATLIGEDDSAMFIVLAPNRTDYRRNFALVKAIKEILS